MKNIRSSSLLKLTAMLLTLVILVGVLPANILDIRAKAAPPNVGRPYDKAHDIDAGQAVIKQADGNVHLVYSESGNLRTFAATNQDGITVEDGFNGTVILHNVKVRTGASRTTAASAPMSVRGGGNNASPNTRVLILLSGDNQLFAGFDGDETKPGDIAYSSNAAGLEVRPGATITIDSIDGTLNNTLWAQSSNDRTGANGDKSGAGAGIGASDKQLDGAGGNIVIRGGKVKAVASYHGAGIGDGWAAIGDTPANNGRYYWNGTILIYGGYVESMGGTHGAGMGAACRSMNKSSGHVIVLPGVKSGEGISTTVVGSKPQLGGLIPGNEPLYIGDMGDKPADYNKQFLVKLNPAPAAPVKVYADFSSSTQLNSAITTLIDDPHDPQFTLFPDQIYLGTTGPKVWKGTTYNYGNDELYTSGLIDAGIDFRVQGTTTEGYNYNVYNLTDNKLSGANLLPASTNWGYRPSDTYGPTTLVGAAAKQRVIEIGAAKTDLEMVVDPATLQLDVGYDATEAAGQAIKIDANHASTSLSAGKNVLLTITGDLDKFESLLSPNVKIQYTKFPNTVPEATLPAGIVINDTPGVTQTKTILIPDFAVGDKIHIEIPLAAAQPKGTYGLMIATTAEGISGDALPDIQGSQVEVTQGDVYAVLSGPAISNKPYEVIAKFYRDNTSTIPIGVKDITAASFTKSSNVNITSVTPVGTANPALHYSEYKISLTPATSNVGDIMSINLPAGKGTDNRGTGNLASNPVLTTFDNSGPTIEYNVDTTKPYNKPVTSVSAKILTNGSPGADRHVIFVGGTPVPAGAVTLPIGTILQLQTESGTPIAATYTVAHDTFNGISGVVITPGTPLGEGKYKIAVVSNGITNNNAQALAPSSAMFEVRIPSFEIKPGDDGDITTGTAINRNGKIHAIPAVHPYVGGKSDLVVHGKNLKKEYLDPGQFKLYWTIDGVTTTITDYDQLVFDGSGTSITFKGVDLPVNSTNAHKSYEFWCEILMPDGSTDKDKATVVVKSAATDWTSNDNGFRAVPPQVGFEGGTANITVKGENIHHYADLKIVVERNDDASFRLDIPVTPDIAGKHGLFEKVYDFIIPLNNKNTPVIWTYKLFDGATDLTATVGSAQTIQDDARPAVSGDGFVVADSHSAGGTKSVTLPDGGGTVYFTVNGVNLNNFQPMSVINDSTLSVMSDSSFEYSGNSFEMAKTFSTQGLPIPANKTQNDIVYTFTLTQNGSTPSSHTVTVIVEKPEYGVENYEADIVKHPAAGGDTVFTITGKNLDVMQPLELVDQNNTSFRVVVTTFDATGSVGTIKVPYPAHDPAKLRNDEYFMEVYVDGNATGRVIKIEVGPSKPSITNTFAQPDYFANVEELMKNNSDTTIKIEGNYLENYNTLEIHDKVTGAVYTVSKAGCDMEASSVVKVPSALGSYTYEIWADGAYSGFDAIVRVGVGTPTPGDPSGGLDDGSGESSDNRPKEEEFKAIGGGSKGTGYTGDKALGFDVLKYQSERAGSSNPLKPVITLLNTAIMTQEHFNLAAEGVKRGAQSVTRVNGAPLEIVVNTSSAVNPLVIEGQLYITANKPLQSMLTSIYTREDKVSVTKNMFKAKFDNENIWVISMAHNGSLGTKVEVAALIEDMPVKNSSATLHIYSFDRVTGEYTLLKNTDYYFDSAGYLHFNTEVGGDIVASDKPLTINGQVANTGTLAPIEKKGLQEQLLAPVEPEKSN